MSNPIFSLIGSPRSTAPNAWEAFRSFASTVSGNPQTIVQNLLNTGRMTPEQFNELGRMADSILKK